MEDDSCSYRYVSNEDIKKTNFSNNSSGGEVYLSIERQEEIKRLMFSALEDPREKYKKISVDEMTKDWIKQKTLDSN